MYNIDRLWWKVCFPILFRGLFSSAFEGAPALFSRFRRPGTSSSGSPEKWWKYIQWGCASEFFSTVRSRGWLRAGFQELVGGPGPWIGRWTCRLETPFSVNCYRGSGGVNFTKGRKEVFFPFPKFFCRLWRHGTEGSEMKGAFAIRAFANLLRMRSVFLWMRHFQYADGLSIRTWLWYCSRRLVKAYFFPFLQEFLQVPFEWTIILWFTDLDHSEHSKNTNPSTGRHPVEGF